MNDHRRARPLLAAGACWLALLTTGCDSRPGAGQGETGTEPASEHEGHGHDHAPPAAAPAKGPLPAEAWCFEHGVPEAVCTRCNPSLMARFKEAGDWCAGHGLPESQCLLCNPQFEAKWAALRPKSAQEHLPAEAEDVVVERWRSPLRGPNDPTCDVESNQIRFLDGTIAAKAGITVEPVTKRRMSAAITCPAEVRYAQTQFAHITPRATGVVLEVPARLGDAVSAGDVLVVIDSAALGQAKSGYIEAREGFLLARADLDRHHAIHRNIEAMLAACEQPTTSEELRRKYAGARIGDAKSRLLTAHAQLELARQRHEREKGLAEKGISTQESLQAARSDLDKAEAEFAATHEAIDIEMETEHLSLERALKVARVALDAARRQLQLAGVSDARIQALDNDEAEDLGRYELRSPINGTVVKLHAVVGELVDTETALVSVADLSTMWLMLSLRERDLVTARFGQRVSFVVDGLAGRSFHGNLDWISSEVDDRARTVGARVTLANPDQLLRANMFGTATVTVRSGEEVLAVPESAIQSDGCCSLVFVRQSETVYRPRKVALGVADRDRVEVLDGLAEGEPVVTTGSFLMKTELLKGSIGAGCCEVDPGR